MEGHFFRILLIEDDEDDYFIVKTMLSKVSSSQFKLNWARTYEEGVKALCSNEHDAYLLDYRLGKRNGLEFLHEAMESG